MQRYKKLVMVLVIYSVHAMEHEQNHPVIDYIYSVNNISDDDKEILTMHIRKALDPQYKHVLDQKEIASVQLLVDIYRRVVEQQTQKKVLCPVYTTNQNQHEFKTTLKLVKHGNLLEKRRKERLLKQGPPLVAEKEFIVLCKALISFAKEHNVLQMQ